MGLRHDGVLQDPDEAIKYFLSIIWKTNNIIPVITTILIRCLVSQWKVLRIFSNIDIVSLDKNIAVVSISLDYSKVINILDHELMCVKLPIGVLINIFTFFSQEISLK